VIGYNTPFDGVVDIDTANEFNLGNMILNANNNDVFNDVFNEIVTNIPHPALDVSGMNKENIPPANSRNL